jgi:hypothetical protein
MIDPNKELVVNLEKRIDLLVEKYLGKKEECRLVKEENLMLAGQLEDSLLKLAELQTRYDNLKLAKALEVTQDDAHEAKLKINQMVREIDKCIALLNR